MDDTGALVDVGNSADYVPADDTSSVTFSDFGSLAGVGNLLTSQSSGSRAVVQQAGFGQVATGVIGAGAALAVTLGGRLAAMFGRGAGRAAINGVKFSMAQLWPMIRKYGPTAVAAALGIGLEQLGALAMSAPQTTKHRRRGISARDISTTKRVVRFTNRMAASIGCVHRPRARYRRGRTH